MLSTLFSRLIELFGFNNNYYYNRTPTPEERLVYFGQYPKRISIHKLTIWKKDVQKYDQFVRKILAIKEANDIPDELWSDLTHGKIDVKPYIIAMSDDYESIKHDIMEKAVDFYTKGYMRLNKM